MKKGIIANDNATVEQTIIVKEPPGVSLGPVSVNHDNLGIAVVVAIVLVALAFCLKVMVSKMMRDK